MQTLQERLHWKLTLGEKSLPWQRVYNVIYILYEKSFETCICLWPEFDCPEVMYILSGWQDIKIQLLTNSPQKGIKSVASGVSVHLLTPVVYQLSCLVPKKRCFFVLFLFCFYIWNVLCIKNVGWSFCVDVPCTVIAQIQCLLSCVIRSLRRQIWTMMTPCPSQNLSMSSQRHQILSGMYVWVLVYTW